MTQTIYRVQSGDNLTSIVNREIKKRGLDPKRASEYRKCVYEANRSQFGKTPSDLRANIDLNLSCLDTFGKKPKAAPIEPDKPDTFSQRRAARKPVKSNDRFVPTSSKDSSADSANSTKADDSPSFLGRCVSDVKDWCNKRFSSNDKPAPEAPPVVYEVVKGDSLFNFKENGLFCSTAS